MRKILLLFAILFLNPCAAQASDDYQAYWNGLPNDAKLVLATAYVKGYHDGSCSFGSVFKKVFSTTLTFEQLSKVDSVIPVPASKIINARSYLLEFMDTVYKEKEYAPVNIYNAMGAGITGFSVGLSIKDCLFLFGDDLKARAGR